MPYIATVSDGSLISPLIGLDHAIAGWFHSHVSQACGHMLVGVSEAGSGAWIGIVLFASVLFLAWKRHWYGLLSVLLTIPGGLLLNTCIKFLIQRHRPIPSVVFAKWDGYSFPSGHTVGATLLYGMLVLALLRLLNGRHWRILTALLGVLIILLVGFSRIALCAHYLTDVLGAMVLGLCWMVICAAFVSQLRRRLQPKPVTSEITAHGTSD